MMRISPNSIQSHGVPINPEKSKSRANIHVCIILQAFLYKILNMYKLFWTPYFSPQAEAQLNDIPF